MHLLKKATLPAAEWMVEEKLIVVKNNLSRIGEVRRSGDTTIRKE